MSSRLLVIVTLGFCACTSIAGAQELKDTYLDETARALVRDARIRRQTVDRSIEAYRVLSTERMSIGYRTIGRERLLFRRETASRVHWSRTGPIEIDVVGAREVVPMAVTGAQVPADLSAFMPHIAFDPMDTELLIRFDTTAIIHPFSASGERNYKFRTGDSTSIRLPDGRGVRLRELEFIPRRSDPHLIAGSFWVDSDTHSVVQAVFRLARQFEFNRDSEKKDRPPGWVPAMSVDLTYLAVDYGLYDFRWWLPRYVVAEGVVHLGPFGTMPQKYERTYSDYQITGDTLATRVARDTSAMPGCHPTTEITVSVHTGKDVPDSTRVRKKEERDAKRKVRRDSVAAKDTTGRKKCIDREYHVTQSADSALMHSEYLPGSIYAGETLLSQSEMDDIASRINDLPNVPWMFGRPRLALGLGAPGLVRYNRIEGLSLGARGQIDLGRASATGELRYGIAEHELSAELGLQRAAAQRMYRIAAYHRLAATDAQLRPFSLPASLGALLLGVDEVKYFRATGAELTVAPAASRAQWYNLRLYHEHQTDVDVNTNFSLRHLISSRYVFSSNIDADVATQSGADITLRRDFGLNPAKIRGGLEVGAKAENGTFDFVRPTATIRMSTPIPLHLVGAFEAAAGTSTGTVPQQSKWYMGGTTTLRGYPIGALSGDAYWRGRAEIATSLPFARLTLFSDAAWAGDRASFSTGKALLSAGAGFSVLDGIVRLDVAHALRGSHDWRVYLYTGGVF